MIQTGILTARQTKKIREYAIHMDWDIAFGGRSRGNRHLFRVNRLVKFLQKAEGGDLDIALAGGWLHDVGLVKGNRGHCFKGVGIARKFLAGIGVDGKTISRIAHIIEAHDGEIPAETIEAKVVHDADTLDKMGPLGFIRHAWKLSNVDYRDFSVDGLLGFIPGHLEERLHNLYLGSAKDIGKRYAAEVLQFLKDHVNACAVTSEVSALARKGIPTERVILHLKRKRLLTTRFQKIVDEQLRLSFLKRR